MLDAAIAVARFLQFAPAAILFGSALFVFYGLKPSADLAWLRRALFLAAALALFSSISGIMLQAASLGGNAKDAVDADVLRSLLMETSFGKVLTLRVLLAACAMAVGFMNLKRFAAILCALGFALLASYAWTGHAAAEEGAAGVVHTASDALHLLAAGIWIGALVPLMRLLERASKTNEAGDALYGLMRFSGIGLAVVAVLVLSGIVNSWFLIGPAHVLEIFTTAYGVVLLLKLALFGGMLVLAAANRFKLVPDLETELVRGGSSASALAALRNSLLAENALAALVLLAVGFLGTLEPPASLG